MPARDAARQRLRRTSSDAGNEHGVPDTEHGLRPPGPTPSSTGAELGEAGWLLPPSLSQPLPATPRPCKEGLGRSPALPQDKPPPDEQNNYSDGHHILHGVKRFFFFFKQNNVNFL